MESDSELLRRYIEHRSDEAFSEIVRRHLNLVYFCALRRTNGDAHRANDVAQVVFIALARQAPSLQARTVLAGWLFVATRHAAAKAMRTEQRRKTREQKAHVMQESSSNPVPEIDWDRIRPQLDVALDELNERDRDAVLLRFIENRPFAEIGGTLRISDDAARMRVERALEKLRGLLARRGITSTTAALALALENHGALAAPAGLATAISTIAAGLPPSGALLGIFTLLMSTTKTIITAVAIIAIGSALYQASKTHRAEAALVALTQERDDMAKRVKAEEKHIGQLEDQMAAPTTGIIDTAKALGNRRSGGGSPSPGFGLADMHELMRYPEYRKLQASAMKGQLDGRYAALFKNLGLTPEQLTQLKNLLVEKQQVTFDAQETAEEQGIRPAQAVQDAQDKVDGQIKATLGTSSYVQYQQYEQTLSARTVVNQLQQSLGYTQTPLSDEQASQMIQILQQVQQAAPRDGAPSATIHLRMNDGALQTQMVKGGATIFGSSGGQIPISDQVLSAAQTVLSPVQLQALQELQSQQQAQNQLKQITLAVLKNDDGKPSP